MKRILITTLLTVGLAATYEGSTVSAAELGLAASDGLAQTFPAPTVESQLLARGFRGGGGFRRGGGGFRRGGGGFRSGGARRGGGFRSASRGGYRSASRSGGYRSARSGGHRTASRSGARRSNAHAQTRHASHSSRSSHARNAHANNRGRHQAKGNTSKGNNHAGRNGHNGGNGGFDGGAAWDASAIVDGGGYGDYTADVAPVVPDVAPVVVDPRQAVITLVNPDETRTAVYYRLGGEQYVLEAGMEIGHGEETQVISFDRGGSFGPATYTLAPGTYRFVATNHGWDLRTVTDTVASETTVASNDQTTVSDNSESAAPVKTEKTASTRTDTLKWLSGE